MDVTMRVNIKRNPGTVGIGSISNNDKFGVAWLTPEEVRDLASKLLELAAIVEKAD